MLLEGFTPNAVSDEQSHNALVLLYPTRSICRHVIEQNAQRGHICFMLSLSAVGVMLTELR